MKTYIKNIGGKWYAFGELTENSVRSIGRDCPPRETGCDAYVARWSNDGIKYVSGPSPSRNAAYKKARKYGDYSGEVK